MSAKKQHTTPCNDCPWRRKSCPGWLGSEYTPEEWVNLAHLDSLIDCHKSKAKVAHTSCAGAAIYRANVVKRPPDGQLCLPADRAKVFAGPHEFVKHHRSGHVVSSEMGLPKKGPRPPMILQL